MAGGDFVGDSSNNGGLVAAVQGREMLGASQCLEIEKPSTDIT